MNPTYSNKVMPETTYTFLILGEDGDDANGDDGSSDGTINLSGGLITPKFNGDIIEDYFSLPDSEQNRRRMGIGGPGSWKNSELESNLEYDDEITVNFANSLTEGLTHSGSGAEGSGDRLLGSIYWHHWQVNILYCTVLYSTVLYCSVLYCTVLYCTVLYGPFCILLYAVLI